MAKKKRRLKGNFRRPVVAAARRYLKRYAKMSAETKADPVVQVRVGEARSLISRAEAAKKPVKKPKLSKKKGRGNFKRVNKTQARRYLASVSAAHPASKLARFPFKARVREATLMLGENVASEIIARGQVRRELAEKRKAERSARAKKAALKRKQKMVAKLKAEIAKLEAGCQKRVDAAKARLAKVSARRRSR